jgi:hypothetical protein
LPGIVLAADQDDGGVRAEPPDLVNPHVPKKEKKLLLNIVIFNVHTLNFLLTYHAFPT